MTRKKIVGPWDKKIVIDLDDVVPVLSKYFNFASPAFLFDRHGPLLPWRISDNIFRTDLAFVLKLMNFLREHNFHELGPIRGKLFPVPEWVPSISSFPYRMTWEEWKKIYEERCGSVFGQKTCTWDERGTKLVYHPDGSLSTKPLLPPPESQRQFELNADNDLASIITYTFLKYSSEPERIGPFVVPHARVAKRTRKPEIVTRHVEFFFENGVITLKLVPLKDYNKLLPWYEPAHCIVL